MKRQDIIALHQLTVAELKVKLAQVEKEYRTAKLEVVAGKRKNTHIRLIRDQVARIKTIITEKMMAEKIMTEVEKQDKKENKS